MFYPRPLRGPYPQPFGPFTPASPTHAHAAIEAVPAFFDQVPVFIDFAAAQPQRLPLYDMYVAGTNRTRVFGRLVVPDDIQASLSWSSSKVGKYTGPRPDDPGRGATFLLRRLLQLGDPVAKFLAFIVAHKFVTIARFQHLDLVAFRPGLGRGILHLWAPSWSARSRCALVGDSGAAFSTCRYRTIVVVIRQPL